ncbi:MULTISPECIES: ATP synthase F1 subunit gamma [Candidatus Ichthyocystis]|uniref:ATP synthase F1 subunit gamma n=1 Tax=Candidatus Ichthyocystis TaxID=2929841 RepID=UPI000A5E6670|nr:MULTISPECIES: ATP synthase F1 subunit gamma [Ichthyocystis]
MSSAKIIRQKIKSVTSTRKITTAMHMVSASKMRKAQEEMFAMRPYVVKVRELALNLLSLAKDYRHTYVFGNGAVPSSTGFIVISTDKGLCGGLNSNLFRSLLKSIDDLRLSIDSDCRVATIGERAYSFVRRTGFNVEAHVSLTGYQDNFSGILAVAKSMLCLFDRNEISRLFILFNRFENTMKQVPKLLQLLPIQTIEDTAINSKRRDCIFEPSETELVDLLLERYIESLVFESVAEHNSSEQSARMVAMKAASDNAGDFIDYLKLEYNKSRQAAITKELSEIVGGSSVL